MKKVTKWESYDDMMKRKEAEKKKKETEKKKTVKKGK